MSRDLAGIALLVLSSVAFGTIGVLARVAYAGGATALSVVALRSAIGTSVLLPALVLTGQPMRHSARQTAWLVGLGVLYALSSIGIFVGLERLPVGTAILIFHCYPVLAVLLAAALGERMTGRKLGALALASLGVALTVRLQGDDIDALGVVVLLGAAAAVALATVGTQRVGRRVPPLVVTAYVLAVNAVLAVLAGAWGNLALALTLTAWIACVALGLTTLIATASLMGGIARVGSTRASIVGNLEPLVAVVLAAIFLGEPPSAGQLVGGALIIAAVLLLARPDGSGQTETPRPVGEGAEREVRA